MTTHAHRAHDRHEPEGAGMTENDQRREWEAFVAAQHAMGRCEFSGMRATECQRSICDCFETPEGAAEIERKANLGDDSEGVGTGAGRGGDPASTEATLWVNGSEDYPEAPAQAHPLATTPDPPARPPSLRRASMSDVLLGFMLGSMTTTFGLMLWAMRDRCKEAKR